MAINIGNMNACIKDVRVAQDLSVTSPISFNPYIGNFRNLLRDLGSAQQNLPFVYQDEVALPFISYIRYLGEEDFNIIFTLDEAQLSKHQLFLKQIIPDISLAILSNSNTINGSATAAFQEVVSDLYDGFLSEEDRTGRITGRPINPPDRGTLAPLVKWGNPDAGPYTWPISATSILGLKAPIVSLPPAYTTRGLLAWSTLGHETGGHDILHADTGLIQELGQRVSNTVFSELRSIANEATSRALARYWANCVDEVASDVLGILNIGPAAGIGLIGYFRGLMDGRLRDNGPLNGPHPVDILRAYVAAEVVRRLNFSLGTAWSRIIEEEAQHDLRSRVIYLRGEQQRYYRIDIDVAVRSARAAARAIATSRLQSLEGHALLEIQDWTDHDEEIATAIGSALREARNLPQNYRGSGFYAAHVVAAATLEALKEGADIAAIFSQMKTFLVTMHQDNISWEEHLLFTIRDLGLRSEPAPFDPEEAGVPAEFI